MFSLICTLHSVRRARPSNVQPRLVLFVAANRWSRVCGDTPSSPNRSAAHPDLEPYVCFARRAFSIERCPAELLIRKTFSRGCLLLTFLALLSAPATPQPP